MQKPAQSCPVPHSCQLIHSTIHQQLQNLPVRGKPLVVM